MTDDRRDVTENFDQTGLHPVTTKACDLWVVVDAGSCGSPGRTTMDGFFGSLIDPVKSITASATPFMSSFCEVEGHIVLLGKWPF